jgi:hypothetical protein
MDYKLIKSEKGIRYMKGSRFCKKTDIPADILARLETENSINTSHECPFCSKPGTEEKTVNGRTYYLCLDDYNSQTTGALARTIALAIH